MSARFFLFVLLMLYSSFSYTYCRLDHEDFKKMKPNLIKFYESVDRVEPDISMLGKNTLLIVDVHVSLFYYLCPKHKIKQIIRDFGASEISWYYLDDSFDLFDLRIKYGVR